METSRISFIGLGAMGQPMASSIVRKASPITLYDIESGKEITRVNFTMDIRNAIHGLEVWPY